MELKESKCNCEDLPVTYCKKCKRFFVVEDEVRTEIDPDLDPEGWE